MWQQSFYLSAGRPSIIDGRRKKISDPAGFPKKLNSVTLWPVLDLL
jgi:hypothetical protein